MAVPQQWNVVQSLNYQVSEQIFREPKRIWIGVEEAKEQSESDESSSDSEKISTVSSITVTKPFSPLFVNNMKKFGVSSDWLAKRSNSLRQSAYSLSSVKSNTSKLDAMIKSASTKPVRSNRKLSFVESSSRAAAETDKENSDPSVEKKEKEEEVTKPAAEPTPCKCRGWSTRRWELEFSRWFK